MSGLYTFLKARKGWVIRLAGSAVLLAILATLLPLDAIGTAFARIPLGVFAMILVLFLVVHVAAAIKWWLLLNRTLPVGQAIVAHFAGLAANLCLPGAVGGDAVRAGLAHRSIRDGSRVVAVGAVDRLIDMLALMTLSIVGFVMAQHDSASTALVIQMVVIVAVITAGVLSLPKLLPMPWKLLPKLPGRSLAERISASFIELAKQPGLLLILLVFSTGLQFCLVGLSWWLADVIDAGATLPEWMFAWPLAKVIAVAPVSLNGLGLREAALAANLAPFGASAALIVAAGLAWQAILFLAGGIGALILAMSGFAAKPVAPAAKGFSE